MSTTFKVILLTNNDEYCILMTCSIHLILIIKNGTIASYVKYSGLTDQLLISNVAFNEVIMDHCLLLLVMWCD